MPPTLSPREVIRFAAEEHGRTCPGSLAARWCRCDRAMAARCCVCGQWIYLVIRAGRWCPCAIYLAQAVAIPATWWPG
jgi:hypothetical protein